MFQSELRPSSVCIVNPHNGHVLGAAKKNQGRSATGSSPEESDIPVLMPGPTDWNVPLETNKMFLPQYQKWCIRVGCGPPKLWSKTVRIYFCPATVILKPKPSYQGFLNKVFQLISRLGSIIAPSISKVAQCLSVCALPTHILTPLMWAPLTATLSQAIFNWSTKNHTECSSSPQAPR